MGAHHQYAAPAPLLAVAERGYGKPTEMDEYRVQSRGGKGIVTTQKARVHPRRSVRMSAEAAPFRVV